MSRVYTDKEFNDYCADVVGYERGVKDEDGDAYNPYYNLHQVAAVVEELINLTGKYPEGDIMDSDASAWKIWHDFVISTMPEEDDEI